MLRFVPQPASLCFFLLSFVGYYLMGSPVFGNPDIPWHLATGDLILRTGSIPAVDVWSYTAGDHPWLNIEWLWDVVLSLVNSAFGTSGMYLFTCTLAALNIAVIGVSLKARGQVSDGYIALMLAIIWLAQLAIIYPYPQLATILFATLFYKWLSEHPQDGTLDKRIFLKLALLMVVWVNTHGGFLVGFVLLGAFGIEAYEKRNWAWFKTGCKLVAVCLVACFINPFHVQIVMAVKSVLHSGITPYLADWQPITFGHELNFTLPLVFFILVSNVRDPNVRLVDKILAFAWLLAALQARRNFTVFMVLSAPYFAYCLQEFMRAVQRQHFKSGEGVFPVGQTAKLRFGMLTLASYIFLLSPVAQQALLPERKLELDPYGVKEVVELVRQRYPEHRFMNDYNLGGYLTYHGGESWKLFIDGRVGIAYPESLFPDFIAFGTASSTAEQVLEKYGINGILIMRGHPYQRRIAEQAGRWKQIYDNGKILAYVRKP